MTCWIGTWSGLPIFKQTNLNIKEFYRDIGRQFFSWEKENYYINHEDVRIKLFYHWKVVMMKRDLIGNIYIFFPSIGRSKLYGLPNNLTDWFEFSRVEAANSKSWRDFRWVWPYTKWSDALWAQADPIEFKISIVRYELRF